MIHVCLVDMYTVKKSIYKEHVYNYINNNIYFIFISLNFINIFYICYCFASVLQPGSSLVRSWSAFPYSSKPFPASSPRWPTGAVCHCTLKRWSTLASPLCLDCAVSDFFYWTDPVKVIDLTHNNCTCLFLLFSF